MVSGQHVQRRRARRLGLAVVICVVATGALTFAGTRLQGHENDAADGADTDCAGPVEVTVSPLLAAPLQEAADALSSDCAAFIVIARPEQKVLEDLFFGKPAPEVWVPQGEWNLEKAQMTVVSEAVASTPVVLVGGPAARAPASWTDALASGRVDLPDPLSDTLGALTVVTPQLEAALTGADPEAARASLVAVAQRYGDVASRGETVDTSLTGLGGASRREVVTTEAAFLAARRTDSDLVAVTPPTGTGLLRFPLAVRGDASPAARGAAERLGSWLTSERGSASLVAAGLRRGDGVPTAPGTGAGSLSYLPSPTSADVDAALLTWRVLSIPSSVLAVFDVSGSMAFDAPAGGRRIDVAVDSATTALALFPDHARIGLWEFSTDRGPGGRDWVVLEPIRRLDTVVDGETQRQRLGEQAESMKESTDGGTGLYDTALAAYRYALQNYDENYSNSVILLTDGSNDDPGSISERELLRRLDKLVDPQRPVRIIGVGVSEDADLATVRRIAAATGGSAYQADTSEDLLRVFAQEIAGR
jgi:hypothetical protein